MVARQWGLLAEENLSELFLSFLAFATMKSSMSRGVSTTA
jgi:hypothetical protein